MPLVVSKCVLCLHYILYEFELYKFVRNEIQNPTCCPTVFRCSSLHRQIVGKIEYLMIFFSPNCAQNGIRIKSENINGNHCAFCSIAGREQVWHLMLYTRCMRYIRSMRYLRYMRNICYIRNICYLRYMRSLCYLRILCYLRYMCQIPYKGYIYYMHICTTCATCAACAQAQHTLPALHALYAIPALSVLHALHEL